MTNLIPSHPYESILCPVDFDDSSLKALRHANLLATSGATVHVLHVVTLIPGAEEIADSIGPGGDESARERLQKIVQAESPSVKVEIHVKLALRPHIAGVILTTAREVNADLIVIATHGRAGVAHFLLGSVAEALVRRAPCPVLTVRG